MSRRYAVFSRNILRTILLTALAGVQVMCFARTAEGSSAKWPTTEFKVVHHHPTFPPLAKDILLDKVRDWFRETIREKGLSPELQDQKQSADLAWERLVEGYLHDIAVRYQEAGFEPPDLRIIEEGGKRKYVVYLIDFTESVWLTLTGSQRDFGVFSARRAFLHTLRDLIPWRDVLSVAREKFPPDGNKKNEVYLYSVLAHELFHGLQATYDRKFGSIGMPRKGSPALDVMVEGVADGAATYLVSKKFPNYLETNESSKSWLGGFEYYTMFLNATGDSTPNAYHTGSFWFHLAERFGSLSVIEYLYRHRLPGLTMADRIRWLELGLTNHPGIKEGLYTIFPHFGAELASYGAGRYQRVTADTWLSWTLGGCKTIEFTPGTEVNAKYVFELFGPIEARCVEASWSGFPADGQLQVEAIGSDRDVMDQLHLGIASGEGNCWKFLKSLDLGKRRKQTCLLEKLKVHTGPKEGLWAKTWELASGGYGAKGRAVFVVSNVAIDPASSWSGDKVKKSALADGTIIRFGFARSETQAKKLAPPEAEHLRLPPPPSMREMLYGIKNNKPMPRGLPIPEIRIPALEITGAEPDFLESHLRGNPNRRKSEREYRVQADPRKPIVPGYTGPFYGVATLHDPSLGPTLIMSILCDPDGKDRPIGQVLHADQNQIKVHVKTDLCEMKLSTVPSPGQTPIKVDHLDAVMVLPFGWRYFRETAPVDVITPGVEIFIDRYHARMQELLGPRWPVTGGPNIPGPGAGPGGGGGGGAGAGSGSGQGTGVGRPGCDCSCKEFERMKVLSKSRDAESQKKLKEMAMCAMQCTPQWTACAHPGISP